MSDHIPVDLMIRIFERLPADCLVRSCLRVCKSWRRIISDPDFIRHYSTCRNTPDTLIIRRFSSHTTYTTHSIDLLPFAIPKPDGSASNSRIINIPDGIKIPSPYYPATPFGSHFNSDVVGICNGLVCLSDPRKKIFILWNPSIRCTLSLPPPPLMRKRSRVRRSYAQGFGFDAITDDYKYVRMIYGRFVDGVPQQVDVYSVKNNNWRSLPCPSLFPCLPPVKEPIVNIETPASFVNGVLHWIVDLHKYFYIISFHLASEVFGTISLPECYSIPRFVCVGNTTIGGESLALIYNHGSIIQVWEMQIYGDNGSWKKVYELKKASNFNPVLQALKVRTTEHGDLLLLTNRNGQTLVYDPLTGCMRHGKRDFVKICGAFRDIVKVYVGFYTESLALSNEGRRLGGVCLERPNPFKTSRITRPPEP